MWNIFPEKQKNFSTNEKIPQALSYNISLHFVRTLWHVDIEINVLVYACPSFKVKKPDSGLNNKKEIDRIAHRSRRMEILLVRNNFLSTVYEFHSMFRTLSNIDVWHREGNLFFNIPRETMKSYDPGNRFLENIYCLVGLTPFC